MNHRVVGAVGRAMDSSATVRVVRRVVAGSAVCGRIARFTASLRRTRERIVAGLGGEWSGEEAERSASRIDMLVVESRIIDTLRSWSGATSVARREARTRRMLDPILSLDRQARVRVGGEAIVIAVLTHTFLLAVLGVPVQSVGWSIRAGFVAAGLTLVCRPDALAAAWKDKSTPPTSNS
jgi:hypothetical protein